ncbi:membrane protein [Mycobacterium antarcticum]|uniref:DUF3060 domain-containing protein n=1 Tax=unclassified Mycolicibacterium TaxID=2636767 RepID=UPI0023835B52|nr:MULTISPECIES: DUF3060 domain-containing protein [unclassified Mycolicibacterium]GLP74000.1 membrane protein [Mycolicibacterium sp. TUM20983]GLP79783.1 membrane protein [Mycolicibacterium sp. TUM20984]
MSSPDDPEARIRDLERTLGEQSSELTQSSYELGTAAPGYQAPPAYSAPPGPAYQAPQPPYGMPFPTMPTSRRPTGRPEVVYVVAAVMLMAVIGGTFYFVANVFSNVNSFVDTFNGSPTASGGGSFDVPPNVSGGNRPPAPTVAPTVALGPPGGDLSVAGVGGNKTIACNDSIVNVSGVSNTVRITGQCRSVTVSGVENTVTVDSAATISASGFSNRVTFLSGAPEIAKSGDSNIVEPG